MLLIKYSLFALISTAFNLLFQFLSFKLYSGTYDLYIGMLVGTIAGLVIKYILDKKFIFYHQVQNKSDDAKKFFRYSFMGIFTTIIFWSTEILFDYWFVNISSAKYLGALIGLSIGYIVKYYLDKKYVFIDQQPTPHEN